MREHLRKAMREAKVFTSWIEPNEHYEQACLGFLDAILDPRRSPAFLRRVERFVASIAPAATVNMLGMLTLKCLAPGVPDFYQGTELPDFSLTDPDNRRPVDFGWRAGHLDGRSPDSPPPASLMDPALKLWLTRALLRVRADCASLLAAGDCGALPAEGPLAQHLFGIVRRCEGQALAVVVPRLVHRLLGGRRTFPADAFAATAVPLPPGFHSWTNLLSGHPLASCERVTGAELFATAPVAVLGAHA
jgi:(1->4)-alpha-D-glucan 1-alpha-D-glucosylmutase